jgi:hypothetical protein
MSNKFKKLNVDLESICELNHFIHTYSLKTQSVGKPYSAYDFIGNEDHTDQPWSYKINKYGYRGNDWSFNKDSIGFFGCSFTFGIGVEHSITDHCENILGIPCHNIGQPGASSLNILKAFTIFNRLHPLKTAVITLPQVERLYWPQFYDRYNIWSYANIIPHWIDDNNRRIHENAYKFFTFDTCVAYMYDYIKMAELSAEITGTKIIWSSWDMQTDDVLRSILQDQTITHSVKIIDRGSDGSHPGPHSVKAWADQMCLVIKECA